MKRAKLMLSALGVVALLGTAFAFRANNFASHVLFTGAIDQPNSGTACQIRTEGVQIEVNGLPKNMRASTTALTTTCPVEKVVDIDN